MKEEDEIQSSPVEKGNDVSCTWMIQAPDGKRVQVIFSDESGQNLIKIFLNPHNIMVAVTLN